MNVKNILLIMINLLFIVSIFLVIITQKNSLFTWLPESEQVATNEPIMTENGNVDVPTQFMTTNEVKSDLTAEISSTKSEVKVGELAPVMIKFFMTENVSVDAADLVIIYDQLFFTYESWELENSNFSVLHVNDEVPGVVKLSIGKNPSAFNDNIETQNLQINLTFKAIKPTERPSFISLDSSTTIAGGGQKLNPQSNSAIFTIKK